ncbi:hypothetical protein BOTNAR_0039g00090 [Botryotinia narcissicola]|uniref:Uncharacterized protein n=1 Tax=Botryotinia narcissicola TaxID=278944 RepID=A0A4Z1JEE0_9HELO|nr:hypothetical protein BOTNAR_0039g00090 [Botryotinia narcissicola]
MAKNCLEGNLSEMKLISSCALRYEGITVAAQTLHPPEGGYSAVVDQLRQGDPNKVLMTESCDVV